jgi:hypothetical protein
VVSVGARSVAFDTSDGSYWRTSFEVKTDVPTTGVLEFSARRPWGVSKLPANVRYLSARHDDYCVTLGSDYGYERLGVVGLWGLDGTLVIAGARSGLLADGRVDRVDAISDISLSWTDAGCPAFCDESCPAKSDGLWRVVALRVTPRGGKPQQLLPGDHARFEIGNKPYVFVLEHALVPRAPAEHPPPPDMPLCGRAIWSLYRDGVVIDLAKAGQAPMK